MFVTSELEDFFPEIRKWSSMVKDHSKVKTNLDYEEFRNNTTSQGGDNHEDYINISTEKILK